MSSKADHVHRDAGLYFSASLVCELDEDHRLSLGYVIRIRCALSILIDLKDELGTDASWPLVYCKGWAGANYPDVQRKS